MIDIAISMFITYGSADQPMTPSTPAAPPVPTKVVPCPAVIEVAAVPESTPARGVCVTVALLKLVITLSVPAALIENPPAVVGETTGVMRI